MKSRFARKLYSLLSPLELGLCLLLGGLPALLPAREAWEPIAAEDLAATECKAYPGSSAEVLLEQQVLDSKSNDRVTHHHVNGDQVIHHYRRIKIYSPVGASEAGVLNVDYPADQRVWNLEARQIKRDGKIREYSAKEFNESFAMKTGATKIKRLALPVPDLDVGDILEMQWSETVAVDESLYQWWYIQDTWPIRRYVFSLRSSGRDCRLIPFNLPASDRKPEKPRKNVMEVFDLPPFVEEPLMPPMRDVRSWFVLLYAPSDMPWLSQHDVWPELSRALEEDFRQLIKPGAAIKATAAALIEGATTDAEKLQRLYDFCRKEVTNLDYYDSAAIQAARKKLERNDGDQTPTRTLGSKTGKSRHINELFASLAAAAGFEPRTVRSSSRYKTLRVQHNNGWLFVPDDFVVFRIGEQWKYYAPGDYFLPAGMVDKSNELALSLICDPKKVIMEPNPVAPADRSPVMRQGRFQLDAEGNLEGEVEVSLGGHAGITRKKSWRDMQQQEIDEDYRASITQRLPAAEISGLKWENLTGYELPLIIRYKIRIPAYADVVGTKIVFSPNVFEHGVSAIFTSDTRVHPVYFDYAWSEHDDIQIGLPEGYVLEGANAPRPLGDTAGVLGVGYLVGYKPKERLLVYKRDFALGGNGVVAFPVASYPKLKRFFDTIQRSDEHAFVLKPAAVTANDSSVTNTPATLR